MKCPDNCSAGGARVRPKNVETLPEKVRLFLKNKGIKSSECYECDYCGTTWTVELRPDFSGTDIRILKRRNIKTQEDDWLINLI